MRILVIVLFLFFFTFVPVHAQQATRSSQFVSPTPISKIKMQQLQKKLATFTDKVKAERVNRINALVFQINQTQTTYFNDDLTTLTTITHSLSDLTRTQSNGRNLSNTKTDIQTAIDTIENTKREVLLQQKKDYTLTVFSQQSAKTDIQKTTNTLYNDLHTLQQDVLNAKRTVAQALDSTRVVFDEMND